MEGNTVTLGYWGIRGLGQMLRYLLEITETKYEDKVHTDQQKWFSEEKPGLGMDFPNLPYLIDGDFKMSETQAIARYIIRRSNKNELLGGNDVQQQARVEMFQSLASEIQKSVVSLVYNQDFDNIKDKHYDDQIKPKLDKLEPFAAGKKFILGEQLTLPDVWLYEYLTEISLIFPDKYAAYKNIENVRKNVENLPQMQAYINSDRYIKAPFNAPGFAKWTGL